MEHYRDALKDDLRSRLMSVTGLKADLANRLARGSRHTDEARFEVLTLAGRSGVRGGRQYQLLSIETLLGPEHLGDSRPRGADGSARGWAESDGSGPKDSRYCVLRLRGGLRQADAVGPTDTGASVPYGIAAGDGQPRTGG